MGHSFLFTDLTSTISWTSVRNTSDLTSELRRKILMIAQIHTSLGRASHRAAFTTSLNSSNAL